MIRAGVLDDIMSPSCGLPVPFIHTMVRYLLGLELPLEAEAALRILPSLNTLDPVLQAVLEHLRGAPFSASGFRQLQQAAALDAKSAGALFAGVDWMLRTCMRCSLKAKALAAELTDLKVAPQFVAPLVEAVEQGRAVVANVGSGAGADGVPSFESVRWRLDVNISSSSLHRVLRPELTMQCVLTDGNVHTFHVSKQQFNALRHTTAQLLKEVYDAEARLPQI
ncbi:hypothetical protein AB1Y20_006797 [Prymnesium parvum]|uniref:COMM domain-containing protein 5 n=1 Tax=Prymnesium parvum TaxID=97485 RepID=A0AB34IZF7_PRYPA